MPRTLELLDLAWAFGLVAIAIGLAQWQRLEIAGQMALAAARSILQLLVMGLGLQLVWQFDHPFITVGAIVLMTIATAIASSNRISDKMKNLLPIVAGSMLTGLTVALAYTILFVIKPTNWHQPEYIFAGVGMTLGYLLNSTAAAGERLISEIDRHTAEIETHLSLGATSAQAIGSYRRSAIRAALLPTIETLMVAGLVTIPGFLSGELLANISPVNAAGYQIILLFAVLASNMIAAILVTQGISHRYFNRQAQLCSIELK